MENKIKVLHLFQWAQGGIVSLMKNVLSILPSSIESHSVFCSPATGNNANFEKACKVVEYQDMTSSFSKRLFVIYRHVKSFRPQVIHTHSFYTMILAAFLAWKTTRHVCTVHGDYPYLMGPGFKRTVQKLIARFFDVKFVAVSHKVHETLLKSRVVREQNIFLIENGIPLTEYKIDANIFREKRTALGLKEDDYVLISVGRLDREKALDNLLEAVSLLKTKKGYNCQERIHLLLIGEGAEKQKLIQLSLSLKLAGNVVFLGYIEKPVEYLLLADIYVCSSSYEGLSLAVAEAMFSGLPVVATSVGDNPKMIDDKVSGILVPPNNPDKIAEALHDLLEGKYDRKEMGRKAKETIVKRYNVESTAVKYRKLYKLLCEDS
ncbi:MAG: glycosyltransferase [Leadbetterella sp.]|nr:glycosyltransferase [Leadbetterella sp.]